MTEEDLRVGIVGAGGMGRTHTNHYLDVGGVTITAVCDPVVAAAEALADHIAERTGTRPAVLDSAATLLTGDTVRAISICTPPNDHVEVAAAAVRAGVAVLCEKPPTRTVAELATLEGIPGSEKVIQFGLCHVFEPGVRQARDAITSGEIGDVIHLNVRFGFRFPGLADRWFADPEVAGGGIILDTIVHSISVFRALVGEPVAVTAQVATFTPEVTVEDSVVVLLRAASGAVGILQSSWATPPGGASLSVHGTAGEITYDYGSRELRTWSDGEWRTVTAEDAERPGEGRFHGQARSFLAAVRSGHVADNTLADAAATMRILDAAYESARQGGAAVTLD